MVVHGGLLEHDLVVPRAGAHAPGLRECVRAGTVVASARAHVCGRGDRTNNDANDEAVVRL